MPEAAEATIEDSTPAPPRRPFRLAAADAPPASSFRHEPHAGIECRRCHAEIPGHATHSGIGCTDCHAAVAPARAVPGPGDCNDCHHDPAPGRGCAHCHDARATPPDARVTVAARFSTSTAARPRELPFRHAVHDDIECARCHGPDVSASLASACATCHERHHTATSACTGCHAPPESGVHSSAAHLGCGGGGCHQDGVVGTLPLTRAVCLACHRAQAAHEPGAECATCHLVRSPPVKAGVP